jgi:hypothetical protein
MKQEETKLDLSVLDKITIPEVEDLTHFETKVEAEQKEELEEAALEEVDSIDQFGTSTNQDTEEETSESFGSSENTEEDQDSLKEIAKWAHELGIFDYDEKDFQSSEEYFKEKFFEKVKKEALEALPDEIKYLADGYMKGIPLNELINSKGREETYANLSDDELKEDESLQEELVGQWLALQDHDQDEIKDKLESYKDGLLLEKEAKIALKKLKKYEQSYQQQLAAEAQQQQMAAQRQYEQQMDQLRKDIESAESFIPGIQMQKSDKEKLFSAITRRDREGKTELERKMASKDMQLAVAQFVLQLEGKLEAVERKAYTKAAQKTKTVVNSYPDESNKNKKIDISVVRKAIDQSKKQYKF